MFFPTRLPKWHQGVVDTFVGVLRRPRFGLLVADDFRDVGREEIDDTKNFSSRVLGILSPGGTEHVLCVGWSRPRESWYLWTHCSNGRGRHGTDPFFSLRLCPRDTPPVVRAGASLARKIIAEDARRVLDC